MRFLRGGGGVSVCCGVFAFENAAVEEGGHGCGGGEGAWWREGWGKGCWEDVLRSFLVCCREVLVRRR